MPDEKGNQKADPPRSSLHAYKEGAEEAVEGDPTGQDIDKTPIQERGDPEKHRPQAEPR